MMLTSSETDAGSFTSLLDQISLQLHLMAKAEPSVCASAADMTKH